MYNPKKLNNQLLSSLLAELEASFCQNFNQLEYQQDMVKLQLQVIETRFKNGQIIQEKIKMILQNSAYLSEKGVNKECQHVKETISKAAAASEQIENLKKEPGFLNQDQIAFLEFQVNVRSFMQQDHFNFPYFNKERGPELNHEQVLTSTFFWQMLKGPGLILSVLPLSTLLLFFYVSSPSGLHLFLTI